MTTYEMLQLYMARYPLMTAQDAVKLVFQAWMGVGHLIPDEQTAEAYLLR